MPDEDARGKPHILPDGNLRTLFVDNLTVSTRKDGMHLVQFFTSLPEGWSEQVRLLVADVDLKRMLDVLTSQCTSWPKAGDAGAD